MYLYIDDKLIIRSNEKTIRSTKHMLKPRFEIIDINLVDVILSVKIKHTQKWTYVKTHYMNKSLEK